MPPEPSSWLSHPPSRQRPVSAVLDGLLQRSRSSAASFTVRSLSFDAASPLSVRLIVSVVVEVSPSPSLIV